MLKAIVGLANPGKEYQATRHNAGAWFIQKICSNYNIDLKPSKKCFGSLAQATLYGQPIRLFIPSLYMNQSGQALNALCRMYDYKAKDIIVAHDELDFEPGQIRIKEEGGHGGHNGLRDIIQHLGTNTFSRIRIGIGHPGNKNQVSNYVLKVPSIQDRENIDCAINIGIDALDLMIQGDLQNAMQQLHNT